MGRKKLDRPDPKAFSVRVSQELYDWIAGNAEREHRSLNAQIVVELEKQMRAQQSGVTLSATGMVGQPSE